MKIFSFLLTCILVALFSLQIKNVEAQELKSPEHVHLWVYFTDKGDNIDSKLAIEEAKLPSNAIKRRRKHKPVGTLAVFNDIPVFDNYISKIEKYATVRVSSKWLNAISVDIPVSNIQFLKEFSFIKKISRVRKVKELSTATLPDYSLYNKNVLYNNTETLYNLNYGNSLKQLEQIGVPEVHDLGYNGNEVIVCVLDAGFNNLEHETFASLDTIATYDFVNHNPNVDDEDTDEGSGSHGTMTLSCIAGFSEGELIGPAYGARYILAKTENTASETLAEEDAWVEAIEWAETNYGPDVTNTSLGYVNFDDGFQYSVAELNGENSAISIASEAAAAIGIIVVQSAGNSGHSTPTTIGTPADADSTLTIGAVDSIGTISSFSSCGPTGDGRIKPELMAMGTAVYVATPNGNDYYRGNGTSFSGPIAAGAATLLIEMAPDAKNYDIIEALKMSASNSFTPDNYFGWGIINLPDAYQWLINPHLHHIPISSTEETSLPFVVEVEAKSAYPILAPPTLYYRIGSGGWIAVQMNFTTGNLYIGEIPAPNTDTGIEYYITVENVNTAIALPENAPLTVFAFYAGASVSGISTIDSQINIYPNPSSRFIHFDLGNKDAKVTIFTVEGRKIIERHTKKNYVINIDEWKPGIYFAKIEIEGKVITRKLAVIQ